ncbi:GNAT family N-acetyltransferase [Nocardia huaxiensis]|uniref:GNAT family N-acetyltransferase n=1 Tax=Nocardia huaxiensis TaxID=2755382 RepID=UPI001E64D25C|nr:GNAT family N-acetyltransferase [Nocardia huaxiensis]UFS97918.1 GNAT family N-acetyltransferase [Nocardia huaxiensis]
MGVVEIRAGRREDADAVAALHTSSWRTAYAGILPDDELGESLFTNRLELWRGRLSAASAAALLVAESDAQLLGFAYLTPQSDGRVLLDNLHVRPTRKRNGTGTQLFRHALGWSAAEYPDRSLYLEVLKANAPAIAFYERQGGVLTADRVVRWPQGFSLPELEYTWAPAAIRAVLQS